MSEERGVFLSFYVLKITFSCLYLFIGRSQVISGVFTGRLFVSHLSLSQIARLCKMNQKKLRNRIAIAAGAMLSSSTLLLGNGALGNPSDISGTWDENRHLQTRDSLSIL
jgi:hypothetical protein